jgi:hypothetical protein
MISSLISIRLLNYVFDASYPNARHKTRHFLKSFGINGRKTKKFFQKQKSFVAEELPATIWGGIRGPLLFFGLPATRSRVIRGPLGADGLRLTSVSGKNLPADTYKLRTFICTFALCAPVRPKRLRVNMGASSPWRNRHRRPS